MSVDARLAPLVAFGSVVATCAVTYPLSILLGHVRVGGGVSWVPFISSTINYPPESCIGSIGLGLCSFFIALTAIVKHATLPTSRTARAALACACLSALGLLGVASFQYHNVPAAHDTWVFFVFGGAAVYMACQVALERRALERDKKLGVAGRIRLAIAVIFWLTAIPIMTPLVVTKTTLTETIGACAEIVSVVLYAAFFLTFLPDLGKYRFVLLAEHVPPALPLLQ